MVFNYYTTTGKCKKGKGILPLPADFLYNKDVQYS